MLFSALKRRSQTVIALPARTSGGDVSLCCNIKQYSEISTKNNKNYSINRLINQTNSLYSKLHPIKLFF